MAETNARDLARRGRTRHWDATQAQLGHTLGLCWVSRMMRAEVLWRHQSPEGLHPFPGQGPGARLRIEVMVIDRDPGPRIALCFHCAWREPATGLVGAAQLMVEHLGACSGRDVLAIRAEDEGLLNAK